MSFKSNWDTFYYGYGGSTIYWNVIFHYGLLIHAYRYWFTKLIKKNSSVLDLGAGKLFYRELIRKYTSNYKSLDVKKTHPDLDYIGTASRTGLPRGKFDLVFCSQVLEHVPDPQDSFREIYRIVKKGGYAIISVPFFMYLHEEPYDFYRYTKYALKKMSEDNGFTVLEITEIGGPFAILATLSASIIIGATWDVPIIKWVMYLINLILQQILGFLDFLIKPMKKILPANYLLIIQKN